jgi:hypothetical protein
LFDSSVATILQNYISNVDFRIIFLLTVNTVEKYKENMKAIQVKYRKKKMNIIKINEKLLFPFKLSIFNLFIRIFNPNQALPRQKLLHLPKQKTAKQRSFS